MAKVKDKFLKFDPLAGADGYRVYYDTDPIDQVSSPNEDIGNQTEDISMHQLLGDVHDNFNIGVELQLYSRHGLYANLPNVREKHQALQSFIAFSY